MLADLDEHTWQAFDKPTVARLAEYLARETQSIISSGLPPEINLTRLGPADSGLTLDGLKLSVRSINCLTRAGYDLAPDELCQATIGELLELPYFGAVSLLDVLTAYEQRQELRMVIETERQQRDKEQIGNRRRLVQELSTEWDRLDAIPGALSVGPSDPRFGDGLRLVHRQASSLEEAIESLLDSSGRPSSEILERVRELHLRIAHAMSLTFEAELLDILESVASARDAAVVIRYHGWDGAGGTTLQVVGDDLGITRERVRQIIERALSRLPKQPVVAPVLDRALAFVSNHAPIDALELSRSMQAEGITEGYFNPIGLRLAAEVFQREFPVQIDGRGSSMVVVSAEDSGGPAEIRFLARKLVSRFGVASVPDIAARLTSSEDADKSERMVRETLQVNPECVWLDEEQVWFWLQSVSHNRNRLLNYAAKISSVAPRVSIGEMRTGLGRHYRMKGFAPPTRVLEHLFEVVGRYRVQDGYVSANPPFDPDEVLGGVEKTMMAVLRELGPVLPVRQFEDECFKRGVNRSTFWVYIQYWPIFVRVAPSLYSYVGAEIAPGKVEDLQRRLGQPRGGKVLKDFGWTDGRVWFQYQLNQSTLSSGVVSLPSAFRDHAEGEYALSGADGDRVGALVARGGHVWGLGPFFRRRGGDAGDTLLLILDKKAHVASAEIGDESIVDGFSVEGTSER
ncbi:MAG: DNA-directed RNA polymerase subunit alpha C-terminal domain-containing protein [Actinomycetota bacterium]